MTSRQLRSRLTELDKVSDPVTARHDRPCCCRRNGVSTNEARKGGTYGAVSALCDWNNGTYFTRLVLARKRKTGRHGISRCKTPLEMSVRSPASHILRSHRRPILVVYHTYRSPTALVATLSGFANAPCRPTSHCTPASSQLEHAQKRQSSAETLPIHASCQARSLQ